MPETEIHINLAPPLTAAQLAENAEFQASIENNYQLTANSKDAYARMVVAANLNVLAILAHQFDGSTDDATREKLTERAEVIKRETCLWLISLGEFKQALNLAADENLKDTYRMYLDAENAVDTDWCEHPRYKLAADGKTPFANYHAEFFYFSPVRRAETAMQKCGECEFRNATAKTENQQNLEAARQKNLEKALR